MKKEQKRRIRKFNKWARQLKVSSQYYRHEFNGVMCTNLPKRKKSIWKNISLSLKRL